MRALDRTRTSLLAAALACALGQLGGCPEDVSGKPPQACVRAYDKCTLASGVLGICDTAPCADGQAPPCLICRAQH